MDSLHLYNSLSRQKERFEPLKPPFVGIYLCGPTVYGDPHLGNIRPSMVFDVLTRYLRHLGFKVRYVRNITDVGHLENDADEGEDKIAKKARVEQLEPMEVAQYYTDRFQEVLDRLNVIRPSIEPRASGHIHEQIEMVQQILASGFAYESQGSVYFDVRKYADTYPYGKLSGRDIDELLSVTRTLDGTEEKRHPADFALWKSAAPMHIMRWNSPWGEGFPGWHLECSLMSTKYLGDYFDIHGGGMDLKFPHHEAEIAQCNAAHHPHPTYQARYWVHNNMVTLNGVKMSKSLGNVLTPLQTFAGESHLISKAYSPMTLRFFMLQAHYRSTLDFTDEGLQAAEKGLTRLLNAIQAAEKIPVSTLSSLNLEEWEQAFYGALNDDLNTAIALAELFRAAGWVYALLSGEEQLSASDRTRFIDQLKHFAFGLLGLKPELEAGAIAKLDTTLGLLAQLRLDARKDKNFALSDHIRDELKAVGIQLKDGPKGTTWDFE